MAEVALGNAELAERKRLLKLAEAEEEAQIAEYIRQRDAREQVLGGAGGAPPPQSTLAAPAEACCQASVLQELADERESQAKLRELEVARLRAMQEKILDNRSAEVWGAGRGERGGGGGGGARRSCRGVQLHLQEQGSTCRH
jgi:hypothetical protein